MEKTKGNCWRGGGGGHQPLLTIGGLNIKCFLKIMFQGTQR